MTDDRGAGDRSTDDQSGDTPPPELVEFSSRLSKVQKARAKKEAPVPGSNHGAALRLGSDFIAGIIVGGLLGWGIDRSFGTTPWGLIVFLSLGFVVGTRLAIRSAKEINEAAESSDDAD